MMIVTMIVTISNNPSAKVRHMVLKSNMNPSAVAESQIASDFRDGQIASDFRVGMLGVTCGRCGERYPSNHQHVCREVGRAICEDELSGCETPTAPNVDVSAVQTRKEQVAMSLSELRYEHAFEEPDVRKVKQFVSECVENVTVEVPVRVRHLLKDGVTEEEVMEALKVDVFSGLATAKEEMAHASERVPMLNQRVVQVSNNHSVCSHRLADMFIRKLQHDKNFRIKARAKSDQYKSGKYWRQMPTGRIGDMDEAVRMRFHPHAMRPATEAEARDFRIHWIFGGDDVEVRPERMIPLRLQPCNTLSAWLLMRSRATLWGQRGPFTSSAHVNWR